MQEYGLHEREMFWDLLATFEVYFLRSTGMSHTI